MNSRYDPYPSAASSSSNLATPASIAGLRLRTSSPSTARSTANTSRYTRCATSNSGLDGFSRTDTNPSAAGTANAITQ